MPQKNCCYSSYKFLTEHWNTLKYSVSMTGFVKFSLVLRQSNKWMGEKKIQEAHPEMRQVHLVRKNELWLWLLPTSSKGFISDWCNRGVSFCPTQSPLTHFHKTVCLGTQLFFSKQILLKTNSPRTALYLSFILLGGIANAMCVCSSFSQKRKSYWPVIYAHSLIEKWFSRQCRVKEQMWAILMSGKGSEFCFL